MGAQRILNGEMLYRDFFEFWMPGTFYLLALVFKLFGQGLLVIRSFIFFNFLTIFVLVFLIGRKINQSSWGGALSLAVFVCASGAAALNHNWLGLLFVCLGVWGLLYLRESWVKLAMIGLITGLTIGFNQWQGTAMFIAVSLTLLKIGAAPVSGPPLCPAWNLNLKEFKKFVIYALSTTLIPLFWCLYFWQQSTLNEMLYATIIFPLTRYHEGNIHGWPYQIWWITTIFYLWFLIKCRPLHKDKKIVLLFGLTIHLFTLISAGGGHTALSYPFTASLIIYFIQYHVPDLIKSQPVPAPSFKSMFSSKKWQKQTVNKIITCVLTASIVIKVAYNMTGKIGYFLQVENTRLTTAKGTLYAPVELAEIIKGIDHYFNTSPDSSQSIYIAPWSPFLYYLFDIKDPTRYSHLGPEHYNKPVLTEIINDLERKRINTIVFSPQETHFDTYKPELYQPSVLTQYITQNYEPVEFLNSDRAEPLELNNLIWERE